MKRTFTIETTAVERLFPGDIVHALEPMLGDNLTVTEVTSTIDRLHSLASDLHDTGSQQDPQADEHTQATYLMIARQIKEILA